MKRLLASLLALALLAAPLAAQDLINPQTDQSQLTRNKGQLPGTTTNDFATTGNVGELLTSTCPTGNATVTITIASPAVITYTAHGFVNQRATSSQPDIMDVCPIVFTNSGGALPTGITSGTTYWTVPSSYTTNTFQIATSAANAIAGTSVNTSGSQSGTQTGTRGSGLVTVTGKTVAARPLTAGDWDVQCFLSITGVGNTLTIAAGGVSSTENAFGSFGTSFELDVTTVSGGQITTASPWVPVQISITTNYFCPAIAQFTGSAVANGKLTARRSR